MHMAKTHMRERRIYHKELAHLVTEAEKSQICSWQAGVPGEPSGAVLA